MHLASRRHINVENVVRIRKALLEICLEEFEHSLCQRVLLILQPGKMLRDHPLAQPWLPRSQASCFAPYVVVIFRGSPVTSKLADGLSALGNAMKREGDVMSTIGQSFTACDAELVRCNRNAVRLLVFCPVILIHPPAQRNCVRLCRWRT